MAASIFLFSNRKCQKSRNTFSSRLSFSKRKLKSARFLYDFSIINWAEVQMDPSTAEWRRSLSRTTWDLQLWGGSWVFLHSWPTWCPFQGFWNVSKLQSCFAYVMDAPAQRGVMFERVIDSCCRSTTQECNEFNHISLHLGTHCSSSFGCPNICGRHSQFWEHWKK